MRIYEEKELATFDFWGGAADNARRLTWSELETVESILADIYPDGIDATNLNDLFAFEFESVCDWLGLTEEEVLNRDE